MAVDFSFPAWLRDQHSFADSLAKGAAVGSAIASNVYRNRALSAQIQMEGEQMAYRNRDLDMKQELLKLKLDGEMNEKQGMVEVGKVLSEIAANGDWTNPGARAKFFGVVAKYPNIAKSPVFDNLIQNFQAADTAKARAELETQRQEAITGRNESNIDARFTALNERFDQVLQLEGVKAENRKELEGLRNELNMLRDQFKPLSSGSDRFDLPYSKQLEYQARLDSINDDLKYIRDPKGRDDAIKALTKEYEQYRIDRRGEKPAAAPSTSGGTRVRDKASGKEFIYRGNAADIPPDKYEVLP